MRASLTVALILLASSAQTGSGLADEPPKSWSKTMTSDPETNRALQRYTQTSPDHAQETVKTLVLFRLLSASCVGVKVDKRPLDAYVRRAGFLSLPADDRKSAVRSGAAQFDYLDYEAVAHLCAGSDYLFGSRGVLVKGAMSKGSGRLKIPYDPANPYFPVERLLPN